MKFKHKTGFWDDTHHVEVDELGEVTLIQYNGKRRYGFLITGWHYQEVLKIVKNGIWVEMKD